MTKEEQEAMMRQILAQQEALRRAAGGPATATEPNGEAAEGFDESDQTTWGDPGRNEKCPCGSGKKFKHCHGRLV